MDAICLIAAPRTGTNHLSEVLKNFGDLASFPGLFDLEGFGEDSLPVLRQVVGINFANLRDPALRTLIREKPGLWLDGASAVAAAQGKRLMSFKLFAQHLPTDVAEHEVLARHGLRLIIVVRKQIDAYVSWRKAVELGRWRGADTTGMRIALDIDRFEAWLGEQERWYDHWRNYLNRRFLPLPVVRYEIDIDIPPERALRRFASAAALVGITLRPPATITHTGFERQDKARLIAEKVTNWPEFNREIFARKLERRAFGYAI